MASRRPPARRRPPPRRGSRGGGGSDLGKRILVAIPAIAFAITIIYFGGAVFAAGVLALGLVCIHELFTMLERMRPVRLAGFLGIAGLVVAAALGDERDVLLALVAFLPVLFVLTLASPLRERITLSLAATVLGVYWIGLALADAVLLRGLDHGGALVFMVLLGTFVGDTGAYLGGRAFGTRKLAPRVSPNKTWEGLVIGIAVCVLVVWYTSRTYDGNWIGGTQGLLLGLAVALAAPLGDLFESLIKRDVGTKDTGGLFGVHGGALDRLDAALFSLIAGYHIWLATLT
ncbi:MAG: phosphatidate cytidylyltransferase [Solirubrobacteraceae bacterium]